MALSPQKSSLQSFSPSPHHHLTTTATPPAHLKPSPVLLEPQSSSSSSSSSSTPPPPPPTFTSPSNPPPCIPVLPSAIASSENRSTPSYSVDTTTPSASCSSSAPPLPPTRRFTSNANASNRHSTISNTSQSQRRSSSLLHLSSLRDKTNNVFASLAEPSIRNRSSYGSLRRSSNSQNSSPTLTSTSKFRSQAGGYFDSGDESRTASISSNSRSEIGSPPAFQRQSLLVETNPPSQAYSNTSSDTLPPVSYNPKGNTSKMHQTSSRLLRMTNDERPFTRVSTPAQDSHGYHGC